MRRRTGILVVAAVAVAAAAIAGYLVTADRAISSKVRCWFVGGHVRPMNRSGFPLMKDECVRPLPKDAPSKCLSDDECRGGRCEFGDLGFPGGLNYGWCEPGHLFEIEG